MPPTSDHHQLSGITLHGSLWNLSIVVAQCLHAEGLTCGNECCVVFVPTASPKSVSLTMFVPNSANTVFAPLQRCAKWGAGSCTCGHTPQILTPSRWPSQSSRLTCKELEPEHSTRCSTCSLRSATSSHRTSAGTSSVRLDMRQVKGVVL